MIADKCSPCQFFLFYCISVDYVYFVVLSLNNQTRLSDRQRQRTIQTKIRNNSSYLWKLELYNFLSLWKLDTSLFPNHQVIFNRKDYTGDQKLAVVYSEAELMKIGVALTESVNYLGNERRLTLKRS